jgi:uncharacterized protein YndB with AHSA1/START domain
MRWQRGFERIELVVGDQAETAGIGNPTVRVQRVLPALPEVVYDAWLDPDSLSEWMCPRPARCLDIQIDARVGGSIRFEIEDSGVEFFVAGRFKVLDPPRRLSFTWQCSTWPDPEIRSVVTVSFARHGRDETLMTIDHTLLPPELVEQHQQGWTAIAGQLATSLLHFRGEPISHLTQVRVIGERNGESR